MFDINCRNHDILFTLKIKANTKYGKETASKSVRTKIERKEEMTCIRKIVVTVPDPSTHQGHRKGDVRNLLSKILNGVFQSCETDWKVLIHTL